MADQSRIAVIIMRRSYVAFEASLHPLERRDERSMVAMAMVCSGTKDQCIEHAVANGLHVLRVEREAMDVEGLAWIENERHRLLVERGDHG